MIYYVNNHLCKDLEHAQFTQWLYHDAGQAAEILTEAEYLEQRAQEPDVY